MVNSEPKDGSPASISGGNSSLTSFGQSTAVALPLAFASGPQGGSSSQDNCQIVGDGHAAAATLQLHKNAKGEDEIGSEMSARKEKDIISSAIPPDTGAEKESGAIRDRLVIPRANEDRASRDCVSVEDVRFRDPSLWKEQEVGEVRETTEGIHNVDRFTTANEASTPSPILNGLQQRERGGPGAYRKWRGDADAKAAINTSPHLTKDLLPSAKLEECESLTRADRLEVAGGLPTAGATSGSPPVAQDQQEDEGDDSGVNAKTCNAAGTKADPELFSPVSVKAMSPLKEQQAHAARKGADRLEGVAHLTTAKAAAAPSSLAHGQQQDERCASGLGGKIRDIDVQTDATTSPVDAKGLLAWEVAQEARKECTRVRELKVAECLGIGDESSPPEPMERGHQQQENIASAVDVGRDAVADTIGTRKHPTAFFKNLLLGEEEKAFGEGNTAGRLEVVQHLGTASASPVSSPAPAQQQESCAPGPNGNRPDMVDTKAVAETTRAFVKDLLPCGERHARETGDRTTRLETTDSLATSGIASASSPLAPFRQKDDSSDPEANEVRCEVTDRETGPKTFPIFVKGLLPWEEARKARGGVERLEVPGGPATDGVALVSSPVAPGRQDECSASMTDRMRRDIADTGAAVKTSPVFVKSMLPWEAQKTREVCKIHERTDVLKGVVHPATAGATSASSIVANIPRQDESDASGACESLPKLTCTRAPTKTVPVFAKSLLLWENQKVCEARETREMAERHEVVECLAAAGAASSPSLVGHGQQQDEINVSGFERTKNGTADTEATIMPSSVFVKGPLPLENRKLIVAREKAQQGFEAVHCRVLASTASLPSSVARGRQPDESRVAAINATRSANADTENITKPSRFVKGPLPPEERKAHEGRERRELIGVLKGVGSTNGGPVQTSPVFDKSFLPGEQRMTSKPERNPEPSASLAGRPSATASGRTGESPVSIAGGQRRGLGKAAARVSFVGIPTRVQPAPVEKQFNYEASPVGDAAFFHSVTASSWRAWKDRGGSDVTGARPTAATCATQSKKRFRPSDDMKDIRSLGDEGELMAQKAASKRKAPRTTYSYKRRRASAEIDCLARKWVRAAGWHAKQDAFKRMQAVRIPFLAEGDSKMFLAEWPAHLKELAYDKAMLARIVRKKTKHPWLNNEKQEEGELDEENYEGTDDESDSDNRYDEAELGQILEEEHADDLSALLDYDLEDVGGWERTSYRQPVRTSEEWAQLCREDKERLAAAEAKYRTRNMYEAREQARDEWWASCAKCVPRSLRKVG